MTHPPGVGRIEPDGLDVPVPDGVPQAADPGPAGDRVVGGAAGARAARAPLRRRRRLGAPAPPAPPAPAPALPAPRAPRRARTVRASAGAQRTRALARAQPLARPAGLADWAHARATGIGALGRHDRAPYQRRAD